jgi:hypothetical protein
MDITPALFEYGETMMKACQNGFELKRFIGFSLIETATGCDLYFENLNDVNHYLDACDLNEVELRKHYGFVTDSEIDGEFDQKRAAIEQKINQGARLTTTLKLHND